MRKKKSVLPLSSADICTAAEKQPGIDAQQRRLRGQGPSFYGVDTVEDRLPDFVHPPLPERRRLPADLDYSAIQGLRLEAREKLQAVRPLNLGQASRISGVSPADVAALMIHLERS